MTNLITQSISTILRVIYKVLPKHSQRLVLWSILYGKLYVSRSITKDEATAISVRLNTALSVAKDSKACLLPLVLADVLLPTELNDCAKVVQYTLESGEVNERTLQQFIQSIPASMRYASSKLMAEDFSKLVLGHRMAVG